jgi:hypothetical protein
MKLKYYFSFVQTGLPVKGILPSSVPDPLARYRSSPFSLFESGTESKTCYEYNRQTRVERFWEFCTD